MIVSKTGYNNGFKLLLDVNQKLFCGGNHKWSGAGLSVVILDSVYGDAPWYALKPRIKVSPGYIYNIAVSKVDKYSCEGYQTYGLKNTLFYRFAT